MKKNFGKRLMLFFSPILLVLLVCEIYLRLMPSEYRTKRDLLEQNIDSVEVLILGNSHPASGIDPKHLTLYGYNLAFGSQSLYFDIMLTKKYLGGMANLKYVLIHIDYLTLYNEHTPNRDFFYKYYYDINFKNRKFFKEYILQSFFVYSPKKTFEIMQSALLYPYDYTKVIKGYFPIDYVNPEKVTAESEFRYKSGVFNEQALEWKGGNEILDELDAFMELLSNKNITPILVSCPIQSGLEAMYLDSVKQANQDAIEYLTKKYNVPYLTKCGDDYEPTEYWDADHLNVFGAERFTNYLDSTIMNLESLKKHGL